ncbi:isoprenyl transferase [Sneathiella glossodoripedis]|uniref:isoprenyl transferase n=1 Tax=Sneathiella glossodoripedis TaxID=418853 RepID=UPI00046ED51C|nr:isoprenyl transferase [Sneathiella glossodoripedis]
MGIVDKNDLTPAGLKHIAIIMDGNGRWANKRSLSRLKGHEQGAKAVREAIKGCGELGIPFLTLFAFSSENWKRPEEEVNHLMGLFRYFINRELDTLASSGVKVNFIGDINALPDDIQKLAELAKSKTAMNTDLVLTVALSYGGQHEIVRATQKLAKLAASGELSPADIDEKLFASMLDTDGLPDPDFILRTSGEKRLSNFLLWQSAYSELIFQDVLWPDFDRACLEEAIIEYQSRNRRFGAVSV